VPVEILIRPKWFGDFADDLDSIVAAAREADPTASITVELPKPSEPGRYAVVGKSVLEVVVPIAGGYAFNKVADAVIARARAAWKARHQPNVWPRTHIVRILGPDGEVLREVKVSDDPPPTGPGADARRDRLEQSRSVGPGELLEGAPKSWPGANKLVAAMKPVAEMLAQDVDDELQRMPIPPSNVQANVDAKRRLIERLDKRIAELSDHAGFGMVIGPAWEQKALERLFEVGVRKETDLARDLEDDPWDVAAWCDQADSSGLVEELGGSVPAPGRRWSITDPGRRRIGFPAGR